MRTTKELSNILSSNKCEYSDRKEAAFELLTNGKKFTINRAARKLSNVIIQLGLKGGVYGQVTPVMSECTEAMIILGPSSVKPFINVINKLKHKGGNMYAEEAIKFAIIGLVRIGNQSALPALQEFNNLCKKSDATMGFNICNIVESAIAELSR